MRLNTKQKETRAKIKEVCQLLGVDPAWAVAIALTESSLGINQKSPTGCRGVFQMSLIAMRDLLQEMENVNDDMVDICCGVLFLRLLLNRHKSIEKATAKYCDPNDAIFYVPEVMSLMKAWENGL